MDEIVRPNKAVADYRTEITGITAADLEGVMYSLADVQVWCDCFVGFDKCLLSIKVLYLKPFGALCSNQ